MVRLGVVVQVIIFQITLLIPAVIPPGFAKMYRQDDRDDHSPAVRRIFQAELNDFNQELRSKKELANPWRSFFKFDESPFFSSRRSRNFLGIIIGVDSREKSWKHGHENCLYHHL
jgi:hypothetical protein